MGPWQTIVSLMSRFICWLNFAIWWFISWFSLSEPKIEARMRFYDAGIVDEPAAQDNKRKIADQQKIIRAMYGILGILDGKASALMRYNGIILAVISLFIRLGQEKQIHGLDLAIILITLFSIMLCLLVVGVFWRFLELAFPANGNMNLDEELTQLKSVLHMRETSYQLAWLFAVVVTFLLATRFILHT